jgi:predicted nuclease of predicted toxin-antitoxin system
MKFLADMGISPQTVAWLEEQGHDAVHVSRMMDDWHRARTPRTFSARRSGPLIGL